MSLDVYLETDIPQANEAREKIFIRESGQTKEISREDWYRLHPGIDPVFFIDKDTSAVVYESNITHNLNSMAFEAGIYLPLWRPDEVGIARAEQLIPLLEHGLNKLKEDPEWFKKFNPENGWGNYDVLVDFVSGYLVACRKYPQATVRVSR